ncbi:MAG: hypothetical protein IPL23_08490 [Saprospiraceae bacterium]|nr:hypothetical protein [Saprospiraceae bacterium]
MYEYIRKSGDSLEKFSAQTFTEEILKKNDKIIISLRVGNSYNTEKLFDISYFYKYFDYIIGPNTIDQTLFNKIVLENDYSKIDSQFKQWITENKYDDLYLKIGVLIESKRFDLNCDLLIQIDKSMIFGSQNKRTILPSILKYSVVSLIVKMKHSIIILRI